MPFKNFFKLLDMYIFLCYIKTVMITIIDYKKLTIKENKI